MKTKKTNKKQFTLFKKTVKAWVEFYGLVDWRLQILHSNIGEENAAECAADFENKTCVITLGTEVDSNGSMTDKDIIEYAFHEVQHLLLAKITHLAEQRFIKNSDIEEEEHHLIHIFENKILPNIKI